MEEEKKTSKQFYDKETGVIDVKPFFDDEDPKDTRPYVEVDFDTWQEKLSTCDVDKLKAYINGEIVEIENTEYINSDEYKILQYNKELRELYAWFEDYDLQVAQYNRAERLKETIFLNIDGVEYGTIIDLDNEARNKQQRIRELRNLLSDLGE